jgi:pimeloyl-ACP methyl ester carboxylesterase
MIGWMCCRALRGRRLQVPTLVMWGEKDHALGQQVGLACLPAAVQHSASRSSAHFDWAHAIYSGQLALPGPACVVQQAEFCTRS